MTLSGYIAETIAGFCSGFLVSPFTVIVDKSVIEYANGRSKSLWGGAWREVKHIVTEPHIFFPGFSFRWMYMVYAATYAANNLG